MITREPLVVVARAWKGRPDASERCGIVMITYEFRDTVVLSGATGPLPRADLRQLGTDLLAEGVRLVRCWRRIGRRLPGRLLRQSGNYALWEMDLEAVLARGRGRSKQ